MTKEAPLPRHTEQPPPPIRYRLIELNEQTPLTPPNPLGVTDTPLLPTGRYAVVGNSDLHLVTMPLQGTPQLADGRDWTRPTTQGAKSPSYMHFGLRCLYNVVQKQLPFVLSTRIVIDRADQTYVGMPIASYTILRPDRSNMKVCEWAIDYFYDPDSKEVHTTSELLHLPPQVEELKEWSFQLQADCPLPQ